jgi:hypothetical protein
MSQEQFANPYVAAGRGYVDAVIQVRDTSRRMIAADGNRYKNSPTQHENFPLCTTGCVLYNFCTFRKELCASRNVNMNSVLNETP